MKDYKKILEGVVNIINTAEKSDIGFANICTYIGENCPELKESEDESMVKFVKNQLFNIKKTITENYELDAKLTKAICWIEKQGKQNPNYCHHEVDLSKCSEEYCKAYYDGWNNCNQQHSQLRAYHKPALSEEDNEHVNSLLKRLEGLCQKEFTTTRFAINDDENWLKSLKDKYTWKPSDKQMNTLEYYMYTLVCNEHKEVLFGLYADLKKLREK